MANINDMLESKYLKQTDVPDDAFVTVLKIGKKNIAKEDEAPDVKWLCEFNEYNKPLILNTTNIQLLAKACESDDTDDWIGKEVILYADPNVSYGGKLVGGLRIRKAKTAPVRVAKQPATADRNTDF